MTKQKLLDRCEEYKKASEKMPIMGYPRKNQKEIIEMSTAIIKAICEQKGASPFIAKHALKMAGEIIEDEAIREIIS